MNQEMGHHEGTKATTTHKGKEKGEYLGEEARARADASYRQPLVRLGGLRAFVMHHLATPDAALPPRPYPTGTNGHAGPGRMTLVLDPPLEDGEVGQTRPSRPTRAGVPSGWWRTTGNADHEEAAAAGRDAA